MFRRPSSALKSHFNYLLNREIWGRSSPAARRTRLHVEELETRSLMSAGELTIHPDLIARPADAGGGSGYTPAQIRHAYGFDQIQPVAGVPITGAGQTIAIIDAYNDPNIQGDADLFSQAYGLPSFNQPGGPALSVVTASGAPVSLLGTNAAWARETALDVEWAHAIAPGANILLVEASSDNIHDLLYAVPFAAAQPGVVTVSMSWGHDEALEETSYDNTFTTPAGHLGGSTGLPGSSLLAGGVTFVAATGDDGAAAGAQWPATSPNVLAVGGTTLYLNGNGYGSESAWSSGGGGTSRVEPEPSYQQTIQQSGWRAIPDVSYNADPHTGFSVYNSFGDQPGWQPLGGTSAGTPQWAALLALTDQARALHGHGSLANAQALLYNLPGSDFHAVGSGYNLATGLGTPQADRILADLIDASDPSFSVGSEPASSTTSAPPQNNPFAWLWSLIDFVLALYRTPLGAALLSPSATPASLNTAVANPADFTTSHAGVSTAPAAQAPSVQSATLTALTSLFGSPSGGSSSPGIAAEGLSGAGDWWTLGKWDLSAAASEGGMGDPGPSLFSDLGLSREMALALTLQELGSSDVIPVHTPPEYL